MPLTTDQEMISTAEEVLTLFKGVFGAHPGFRPAHAKGQMLTGTFTPTAAAKELSTAPHFAGPPVPVTARFSDSTGIPVIPDTDPNSKPHGIAIRFNLGEKNGRRWHTDIIGHSTPHFPVQNGKQFAGFLQALTAGTVGEFLGAHPSALRFVTAPKPFPVSLGTENYFMLNAFKFINAQGKETWIRYQVLPVAGHQTISDEEAAKKGENYLFEEVAERVKGGPIVFKIVAQIGEAGDEVNDITAEWPDERKLVELGTVSLDKLVEKNAEEQKYAIFDPIPRVDGIEPSKDPILEFRAALYLISGRNRRAA
jgi:catalase